MDDFEERKRISRFVGAHTGTVLDWMKGNFLPKGPKLIALRYYLERKGYLVKELADLPRSVRDLGRLIAHGLMSLETAAKAIGLTTGSLMRMLHGERTITEERSALIEGVVRQHDQPKHLVGLYDDEEAAEAPQPPSARALTAMPTNATLNGNKKIILTSLARGIESVIELSELVLSREFSEDDRQQLRNMTGGGRGVFDLSNNMAALCSSTARSARKMR